MRNRIIAALAAAVTPLAIAAPASAAPGKGAERYTFSQCFSEPGLQVCVTTRSITNVTETRSGNVNMIDHNTSTFRLIGDGFTASGTSRAKLKLLLKDGQEQVGNFRLRASATLGGVVTCTSSFRFVVVKGEVKKEMDDFFCDGPVPEL